METEINKLVWFFGMGMMDTSDYLLGYHHDNDDDTTERWLQKIRLHWEILKDL